MLADVINSGGDGKRRVPQRMTHKKVSLSDGILTPIQAWKDYVDNRYIEKPRAVGWHPSQLYGMCPRAEIIMRLEGVDRNKFDIDHRLRMTFSTGDALHYWMQEEYFGKMGLLVGDWRCNVCGTIAKNQVKPRVCDSCKNKWFIYLEMGVYDAEYKIVGHCDGVYRPEGCTDASNDMLLEFKTAGPRWWKSRWLDKKHVYQSDIYGALKRLKKTALIYIDKAGQQDFPFQEHILDVNPAPLKDVRDKIAIFNSAITNRRMPMKFVECEVPNSRRCKKCPVGHICMTPSVCSEMEAEWQDREVNIVDF